MMLIARWICARTQKELFERAKGLLFNEHLRDVT